MDSLCLCAGKKCNLASFLEYSPSEIRKSKTGMILAKNHRPSMNFSITQKVGVHD